MSAADDADERVDTGRRRLREHATAGVGGLAFAGASYPFFVSLYPSERARAQGAVEIDLSRAPARRSEHD